MSLVRDIAIPMTALEDTIFVTCSALMSSAASTAAKGMLSVQTTADAAVAAGAETTVNGRIIDRLMPPLGALYQGAVVVAHLHSTVGSTEADRKLTIGAKLQHGDSSGGGDMAEYSTGSRQSAQQYFSTARTTDMLQWDATYSTGEVYAVSTPAYYDLRGAKRYVRVTVQVNKNGVTTESSGDEQARVGASIAFVAGDKLPQTADTTGAYSTTTST